MVDLRSGGLILTFAISWLPHSLGQAVQNSAVLEGPSRMRGSAQIVAKLPTQNVHVYVVFPPASNPTGGKNNDNFRTYVMKQGAIDGVTVQVNWSAVEQGDYTPTACTGNPDVCQQDSKGFYHNYDWMGVDGTLCATNSGSAGLGQWFCSTAPPTGWGAKKVNPLIFGISSNPNASTPHYVTTQQWANDIGASLQDVINNLKDTCGSYKGYGSTTSPSLHSANMATNGVVTVTMSGSTLPFRNGDTIWVKNFDSTPSDFNVTGATTITSVTMGNPATFTYKSNCGPSGCLHGDSANKGDIVSPQSSWPIPTEAPYKVAFRAFVNAAIYHFSHTNTGSGGVINAGQVAYMRVGYARGAEALPECLSNWPGYSSQADSKQAWLNFYADMSSFLMGAAVGTNLHIQTPINEGGDAPPPFDTDYGTQEAGISVQFKGGDAKVFGFGAQGLQASDKTNYPLTGDCASDWCNQFDKYWAGGQSYKYTDFELQQIDCSDPTGTATGLACAQNLSTSKTGNLANLLVPFTTDRHMTILELYNQDALLAYDPKFCTPDASSSCMGILGSCTGTNGDVFPNLDTNHQSQFYECVGQGAACSGGAGTGNGDCTYQTAIDAVQGVH